MSNEVEFSSNKWRNVARRDCVKTIIYSVICFLIALIPFAFLDGEPVVLTISTLPFIGGGEIVKLSEYFISTAFYFLVPGGQLAGLTSILGQYFIFAYFAILLLDVVFAILLIIFRSKIMRIIFKILSIIFSFIYFVIAISFVLYLVGSFANIDSTDMNILLDQIVLYLRSRGTLFALVGFIVSLIMVKNQLKWFSRPCWAKYGLSGKNKKSKKDKKS